MGDPLLSSTGHPLCDVCSDPVEAGDDRDRLGDAIVHADCAEQTRRPLRLVAS